MHVRHTRSALFGIVATSLSLSGCSTLSSFGGEVDERWADYRNWTKVTIDREPTGDPTGLVSTVHEGTEGYRDVFVNDIGRDMLLGDGPYDFPVGTVVVKEQFPDREAWLSGKPGALTVSLKVGNAPTPSADDWLWADSARSAPKQSAFCAGCHAVAAASDYVFTTGTFLKDHPQ